MFFIIMQIKNIFHASVQKTVQILTLKSVLLDDLVVLKPII